MVLRRGARRGGRRGHRPAPRGIDIEPLVHRRGGLRLCPRISFLQRLHRRPGAVPGPDPRHPGGTAERRSRLRPDRQVDRIRPPLRRHRGSGPAHRTHPGRAIRVSPGDLVDPRRGGGGRLCPGLRDAVLFHPPRRPLARSDGARRARAGRWRRGPHRGHGDHGDPDRGARSRGGQRHEAQPVGDEHGGGDHPHRAPCRHLHARASSRTGPGGHGHRGDPPGAGRGRRGLCGRTARAAGLFRLRRPDAGPPDHRLRLRRGGAAGMAPLGAARLPVDLHEDRHHRGALPWPS